MSLWWFGGTTNTITVQLTTATDGSIGSQTASPTGNAGTIANAAYQPYCANSKAANFDHNFTDNTASVKVKVASTSGSNWGLR